ncbi:MAG: glycosyltransferase [Janthinobacterium lividum]
MPELVADSTVPLAVLVLAWDETTPAVRALVEATRAPTPDVASILVMVPQAAHPEALSAEEYLPLPAQPAGPAPPTTQPHALPPQTATTPGDLPSAGAKEPAERTGPTPSPTATVVAPTAEPEPQHALMLPNSDPTALAWSAVQVVRLSALTLATLSQRAGQVLPAPSWTGEPTAPAAPYQGSTATEATIIGTDTLPEGTPLSAALPPTPSYKMAEPLAQASDLEGDLLPLAADELASFEQHSSELPPESAAAWPLALSSWQAGWPEALAALGRTPALEPIASSAATSPTPLALQKAALGLLARPDAPQYSEPNLNFKIIQYARFAVPVALAKAPYAAIYAPAWPTWLAAQELRQRTGGPLVLHVATLPDEPLATATGWMAELQRQALRRADVVLAETPALAQRLRHELNLPTATVHTVSAADAAAIAQALHSARPRTAVSLT